MAWSPYSGGTTPYKVPEYKKTVEPASYSPAPDINVMGVGAITGGGGANPDIPPYVPPEVPAKDNTAVYPAVPDVNVPGVGAITGGGGANPDIPPYVPPELIPEGTPPPTVEGEEYVYNTETGTAGAWDNNDGSWRSGTGGYPISNPALKKSGVERLESEDLWKKGRDAWLLENKGQAFLDEFTEAERKTWGEKAEEKMIADKEADDKRTADEKRKAQYLEDLKSGPRRDIDAPTWETKDYGDAKGWESPDIYSSAEFDPLTKAKDTEYEDQKMLSPYSFSAQNFNKQRRYALGDVDATAARNLANITSQLQSTGGLSRADRIALASQSNREKIMGRQGALGRLDLMEAENLYGTQRENVRAINIAQEKDVAEANRRLQDLYETGARRSETDAAEENLRAVKRQQQETTSSRDLYKTKATAARDKAAEQNLRERETITAQNKAAMDKALSEYGADSDAYKAARAKFILGKRVEYADIAGKNLYDESGEGGGIEDWGDKTQEWWDTMIGN